jgi:hypothetical protein
MPHNLVVKIRGAASAPENGAKGEEAGELVDTEDTFITLRSDADLARAFAAAEAAGQLVQVGCCGSDFGGCD